MTSTLERGRLIFGRIRERVWSDPRRAFWSAHYLRINQRRQEHVVSLQLPLAFRSVLEVGAGIGDHTSFFLDRGCRVVTTDGRAGNVKLLRRRYPELPVRLLDLDDPDRDFRDTFDVVYCYGTLYHLRRPAEAIAYLAARTEALLLLETAVSFGTDAHVYLESERRRSPSQAVSGVGCRPTRAWVRQELARHFEHVYLSRTQPWHEEFPLNWARERPGLARAVFVAARQPLDVPSLVEEIPDVQVRHGNGPVPGELVE